MKIRLDDVMQSFSFPFDAVYLYYIPLETVLMFVEGNIFGKAVQGISSLEDAEKRSEEFIRLPEIGSEGRTKVMTGFIDLLPDEQQRNRLKEAALQDGGRGFESALREEKLLMSWYNYREEVYTELAERWCAGKGLELII